MPPTVTDSGACAARTSPALVRSGQRDAPGHQPGQSRSRIKAHGTGQTRVNNDGNALDRQARLRNCRSQNHFADAGWRRSYGRVLFPGGQVAVKRPDLRVRSEAVQPFGGSADFARAGKKDEQAPRMFGQRLPDHDRRVLLDALSRRRGKIAGFHRPAPALAAQYRNVGAEQALQRSRIQRGRHDEQAQFLTQAFLTVERQRQPKIALQIAFVKFVEQDAPYAGEFRVILQQTRQNAFGDDLDARDVRYPAFQPYPVSHGPARFFSEQTGHLTGRVSGGYPARFKHKNFFPVQPVRVEQGRRDTGRFARSGGRFQYAAGMSRQSRPDIGQKNVDGQRGHRGGRPS